MEDKWSFFILFCFFDEFKMFLYFSVIFEQFIEMAITGPKIIIVIGSNDLAIETATISALKLVILIAFVAEIVRTRFGY